MNDTIATIATAYGEGGIGIIRISGEKGRDVMQAVFKPASRKCQPGGGLWKDC